LGAAQSFALVGGTSVSATGTGGVVTGDAGVSPGTAITGFPTSATVVLPFATHSNDTAAIAAQAAVTTLYADLVAAGPCSPLPAQLTGLIVTPGIYCFAAATDLAATGTLTLNGNGVYIFQVGSAITANVQSTVTLINGADPCKVFWQVTSAATLNGLSFAGNVVAQAGVTLGVGSSLNGRALTTVAGAVALSGTDTVGGCGAAVTPGVCIGDCDQSGVVSIVEVQGCVDQFLAAQPVLPCCDRSGNGKVGIAEIQGAVNAFLDAKTCLLLP
jgi:hypothetical protein